jgi:hypothetical protein
MSLLYNGTTLRPALTQLWKEASAQHAHENAAVAFWNHYLSKYEFPGEDWIIAPESDPALQSLRRVDLVVKFVDSTPIIRVLCFGELKRHGAPPADMKECETQALDACRRHLQTHNQSFVYAMTMWGTRARLWLHEQGDAHLTPLFGSPAIGDKSKYIEENSNEGQDLARGFQRMKILPPARLPSQTSAPSFSLFPKEEEQPTTSERSQPGLVSSTSILRDGKRGRVIKWNGKSVFILDEKWTKVEKGGKILLYNKDLNVYTSQIDG